MNDLSMTISVIIPAYNARDDYVTCLNALQRQSRRDFEVIWIDSASADGSADAVAREVPWVRLVREQVNQGYRGGARLGADKATGKFLIILNQDIDCEPDFLAELVGPLEADPSIGMTAPLILLYDERDRVNEAGNTFHFSGLYGSRGLGDHAEKYVAPSEIGIASGCCFCIRADRWRALGGFSEDLEVIKTGWHAGNEDQDLCWRLRLGGQRIMLMPASRLYHKFTKKPWSGPRLNACYCCYWLTLIRNYRWRSLLALAPFAAFTLGLLWLKGLASGWSNVKLMLRTQVALLVNWRELLRMRRRVQSARSVSDRAIVAVMEHTLTVSKNPLAQRLYDIVSGGYYRLFAKLVSVLGA